MVPWSDVTLSIRSLNDAYRLTGFRRADRWYDIHPQDHFMFAPERGPNGAPPVVYAHQVPIDKYVRPAGHREWLATQPFPVYLHPDYATQYPEAAHWPSARPFPKAEIEAHFGTYFTSTPAWMLAHAVLEGIREIQIYGIHLATESEYVEQRPNFELLIGCVLGSGRRTITVKNGLRRYETEDGIIVLPEASPVLASAFQYAFEPSPSKRLEPLRWEVHKATVKRERTVNALKRCWLGFGKLEDPQPDGKVLTSWVRSSTLQQRLWHQDAVLADCQEALARAHAQQHGV